MKHIAVIGCGYVGTELARLLSKKGHVVTCSTRSKKKFADLREVAQKTAICKGSDEKEISLLMKDQDVIIVTVGADSIDDYKNTYLRTAQSIRHAALARKTPKTLIYTSSTSVYGEHHGFWVDENSPTLAEAEHMKILLETEQTYLSLAELGWKVCIFRLAEIYGPDRTLASKVEDLQGHTLPEKGNTFTNMVHRDDIVKAIDYALNHHLEGIYNLADDDHPLRKELFDKLTKHFKLKPIDWDHHQLKLSRGNKRVSNHKIKAAGFVFNHPHRILDL